LIFVGQDGNRPWGNRFGVAGLSDMRRPRHPLGAVAGRARRLSKRRGGPKVAQKRMHA
jgi:hypothetical protein